MENDPDRELFSRLSQIKDFADRVLCNDTLEDWSLARSLGEFLTRLSPQDILGHALLARASRHLGDRTRAVEEIERCQALFKSGKLTTMEREIFEPFLEKELRLSAE